jgi:riboflavin kinase
MEDKKLITREITKEGEIIRLTEDGEKKLLECLSEILNSIMKFRVLEIKGKVVSGLGEGRLFLSLPYYRESFKKILGFEPYPGTLNILIYDKLSLMNRILLDVSKHLLIPEFKDKDRVLGAVKVYPANINNISPAAVVIPLRTTHPKSVIEIVSPYKLREVLRLEDGNDVTIEVFL